LGSTAYGKANATIEGYNSLVVTMVRTAVAQYSVSVVQQVMMVSNVLESKTDVETERDSMFDLAMDDDRRVRRVHRERQGNPLSKRRRSVRRVWRNERQHSSAVCGSRDGKPSR
jgi:hypothetical protein